MANAGKESRSRHAMDRSSEIADSLLGIEKPVVLALIDPTRYQEGVIELLKFFTSTTPHGIYVTLNKPFTNLARTFERAGIPVDTLFFVDAVTNVPSVEEHSTHICLGPGNDLSNICIAISKIVNRFQEKFLFLDSLSTLLIYNDPKAVAKFAHLLSEKMRRWGTAGSLLTVEMNVERDVVLQLAPFCDKVLKI